MINADELPLVSASIAISFAKNMTADELNVFGNLIVAIGSEMLTISAARAAVQDSSDAVK